MQTSTSHTESQPADETGAYDPPLAGVNVVDLSSGPMAAVGRLLVDMGAHVQHVHLGGITDQLAVGPMVESVAIGTAIDRYGINEVTIDASSADGKRQWAELLGGADILVESTRPGSAGEAALDVEGIRRRHPELVILSISDFGRNTSYSRWQATSPVLHALTSGLTRSGAPGQQPVIPPAELPYHCAAAQATAMTASVYLNRLRTGAGDLIDFSILDGAMQALDPPYGTAGTGSAGVPLPLQIRDWDKERQRYPVLRCKDGHARICLLSERQWRGMFEWMGRPEEFADPKYEKLTERLHSPSLLPAIERFFTDKTRVELRAEGHQHGVPVAGVATLAEALRSEQLRARGFFRNIELAPGLVAPSPVGVIQVDGNRASVLTARSDTAPASEKVPVAQDSGARGLPLAGIRVVDLGVIVVGADTSRLLADLGAEVIKVENSTYPDGLRGRLTTVTQPFAAGHRNKRSIGINLRSAEGVELVRRLVAISDIVLTNFKPGVMQSLGMDYHTLKEVNPGIVVIDSSAFGTGPWATRLGYGPLVRAAAGFTDQWKDPADPDIFYDNITVYPDHVAARIGAFAALAMLIRRERTGGGGSASIAQSEVMLSHLAPFIAADALAQNGHRTSDEPAHDAPWDVFPTAGKDNWVAITVRGDDDWRALCTVIHRPDLDADTRLATRSGRGRNREQINTAVRAWSTQHSRDEAMQALQAAGVPAGAVLRGIELPDWGYYVERRAFREETHPCLDQPYTVENIQIHSEYVADPPGMPAPLLAEQTFEIAAELLGLEQTDVEQLIDRGVLQAAVVPQATVVAMST